MYDEIAMKFAEHHHGVVGTWELADAGLTEDQIRQLLGSRQWDRIGRSVIRRRGSPTSDDQEVAATLLDRGRGAKISGFTAGHLLGLDGCPLRPIQVIGTGATRGRRLPAGYRRVRTLPARWTTEVRGIGLIAPEMCAMQQFALSREETAERRVDVLWSLGRLSGRSIDLFLSDMGRSGRNGIAGLRRYRDARGLDYTPPATGMESRAIQVLRDAGIKVRRQVDVGCDEAWTGRVDLMVVGLPVVVEVQSNRYHRSVINREADAARRRMLEQHGFVWVELWEDDVWARPWVLPPAVRDGIRRAKLLLPPAL